MEKPKLVIEKDIELICAAFSGKNYWETIPSFDLGLNGMFLADGGHGIRKQTEYTNFFGLKKSSPSTVFPSGTALGCTFNKDLIKKVGIALGEEALYHKVNIVLAPSMNIKRNPLCGRNFEYFSEDPYLTGKLASKLVEGIQEKGVAACLKQYCLNNQETNRFNSNVIVDTVALNDIYLMPYKIAIKEAKPLALMTSYNLFNGKHVNESTYLLKDKLKTEFGFDGLIISDWGAINDRVEAFKAGVDLEMPSTDGLNDSLLVDAYLDKKISKKMIFDSLDRIRKVDNLTNLALMNNEGNLDHRRIALNSAEESIVLLKNARNVLPLSIEEKGIIVGPYAFNNRIQGGGRSFVSPIYKEQISGLYKDYSLNISKVLMGYSMNENAKEDSAYLKELTSYIKLAKPKYAIVLFGLNDTQENEGIDRINLNIPKNQVRIIRELSNYNVTMIGVLVSGNVVYLREVLDYFEGLIYAPLCGVESSRAILNILSGISSPSGRLSETWAKDYIDYPNSNIFDNENYLSENALYKESIYIGYRYFTTFEKRVLYPFGYGLSYSSFNYSDIKVTKEGVSLKITNTSLIKSKEVIQVYISKTDSSYLRPIKELKAFEKVDVLPDETVDLFIPFDEWTFVTYDEESESFVKENGIYSIHVALNANNDIFVANIDYQDGDDCSEHFGNYLTEYKYGSFKTLKTKDFLDSLTYKPNLVYKKLINPKKKIIEITTNTVFSDLIYSKSKTIRLLVKYYIKKVKKLYKKGKIYKASKLTAGLINQPLRCLFTLSNGEITKEQVEDIVYMANGHPFKGYKRFTKRKYQPKTNRKSDLF